jgi:bacterioferritin (cytochrome b1)
MAEQTEHMGMNKTGVQMSPLNTQAMLDDDKIITRVYTGDETELARMRESYIGESDGLGSIPPPGTMKGMVSMGVNMLKGDKPQLLLDKMAERLTMERTATRLYDALLTKLGAVTEATLSITLEQVASIRSDEARHALLIKEAIESMGGDPTVQTPCADLAGVEASGLVQVLNDPRTSVAQSLHAILTAELSDNAGWETLIALADEHEQAAMAESFSDALQQERKHLAMIQTWYEEAIGLNQQGTAGALHNAGGAATSALEPGGSESGDGDASVVPPGSRS